MGHFLLFLVAACSSGVGGAAAEQELSAPSPGVSTAPHNSPASVSSQMQSYKCKETPSTLLTRLPRSWRGTGMACFLRVLICEAGPTTAQRSKRTALGNRNWFISHSSLASKSCWSLNSLSEFFHSPNLPTVPKQPLLRHYVLVLRAFLYPPIWLSKLTNCVTPSGVVNTLIVTDNDRAIITLTVLRNEHDNNIWNRTHVCLTEA